MKNLRKQNSGFTIIEVMIVLAIAGLIMAIVFFAVPQLQRNQRDNQRQSMTTRLKAELDTYAANNQGTYPFAGVAAAGTYIDCSTSVATTQSCYAWYNSYIYKASTTTDVVNTKDPSTGNRATIKYSWAVANTNDQTPTWAAGTTWILASAKCSGDHVVGTGTVGAATSKQYALLTALERDGTYYCVDNG